jgi:IclR-like helix-turn-helix domain-containing protein
MSDEGAERRVKITLTDAQVAKVVLVAAGGTQLAESLSGMGSLDELRQAMLPLLDDHAYSHSTFRAAIVLAAFPDDGSDREVTDVARTLGLSPSTTHRYARTWTALGLLEQDAGSRRYRRPPDAGVRGARDAATGGSQNTGVSE